MQPRLPGELSKRIIPLNEIRSERAAKAAIG
jgi:hypothetical protein